MSAVWVGDRVYHKDDPRGAHGEVLELREFGERGCRALVRWDGDSIFVTRNPLDIGRKFCA